MGKLPVQVQDETLLTENRLSASDLTDLSRVLFPEHAYLHAPSSLATLRAVLDLVPL